MNAQSELYAQLRHLNSAKNGLIVLGMGSKGYLKALQSINMAICDITDKLSRNINDNVII